MGVRCAIAKWLEDAVLYRKVDCGSQRDVVQQQQQQQQQQVRVCCNASGAVRALKKKALKNAGGRNKQTDRRLCTVRVCVS